jgi:23S rRNA pseudouridine1911/1915/1917 synthase
MHEKKHCVTLEVHDIDAKVRVDAYIAANVKDISRSLASDDGTAIMINGRTVKKSHCVHNGETITVNWTEELFGSIEPQDIPLDIVYEDDALLVINKQQFLVVHPAAGNQDGTLVNALVFRYGKLFSTTVEDAVQLTDAVDDEGMSEDGTTVVDIRPGIVHRLDKDTSGVMVVAKTRQAHTHLAQQFKEHTNAKFYIAIVKGVPTHKKGTIITSIVRDPHDRKKFTVAEAGCGKYAETDYLVLRQYGDFALVRLRLHTGRTHQIRVHLAHLGCPILGDAIYGRHSDRFPGATLMLHALTLEINHPVTGKRMRFHTPMPDRFKKVLRTLKSQRRG